MDAVDDVYRFERRGVFAGAHDSDDAAAAGAVVRVCRWGRGRVWFADFDASDSERVFARGGGDGDGDLEVFPGNRGDAGDGVYRIAVYVAADDGFGGEIGEWGDGADD